MANKFQGVDPRLTQIANASPIPFTVTSGLRTSDENRRVGGVANSFHLTGNAIDIRTRDLGKEQKSDITRHFNNSGFQVIDEGNHLHVEPFKQRDNLVANGQLTSGILPGGPAATGAGNFEQSLLLQTLGGTQQQPPSPLAPVNVQPTKPGAIDFLSAALGSLGALGGTGANIIAATRGRPGTGGAAVQSGLGLLGQLQQEQQKQRQVAQQQNAINQVLSDPNIDARTRNALILQQTGAPSNVIQQLVGRPSQGPDVLDLVKLQTLQDFRRQQLGLKQQELDLKKQQEDRKGPVLTKGQEKFDEAFAKDVFGFREEIPRIEGDLSNLERSLNILRENPNITGPDVGSIPKKLRDFSNPEASDVQESVELVTSKSLKKILGAQFGITEGERLLERTFNPSLSGEINARRVEALLNETRKAFEAKKAQFEYFQENGTLKGFKGPKIPTASQIEQKINLIGKGSAKKTPQKNLRTLSRSELDAEIAREQARLRGNQ